jgi:uncharacterized phiE125 gp8 family phage protein
MIGRLTLVTAPAALPLSWASEVMGHLRLDGAEEQARVESVLVPAAVGWAEGETNRALIHQTWKLQLDEFPYGDAIEIPKPPLVSVTGITYVDPAGVTQTWAPAEYVVDAPAGERALPGRVYLAYDKSWPDVRCQRDAIAITFQCGYGATHAAVPAMLRSAMLLVVGELFERRELAVPGTINEVPMAARALARPFRVEL